MRICLYIYIRIYAVIQTYIYIYIYIMFIYAPQMRARMGEGFADTDCLTL